MEFLLRFIVGPAVLALVSTPIVIALGWGIGGVGVFFSCWIVWIVIINGGFLFFDGDMNFFD